MATQAGPIAGLAGAILWTERQRFQRMRDFYVQSLRLQPRSDRDDFVSFVLEPTNDVRLSIAVHDAVSGPAREPLRSMLHLRVDDIHEAHAALVDAGVQFSRPPEQEPWGGWIATFADPDGNTLQLLQPVGTSTSRATEGARSI